MREAEETVELRGERGEGKARLKLDGGTTAGLKDPGEARGEGDKINCLNVSLTFPFITSLP